MSMPMPISLANRFPAALAALTLATALYAGPALAQQPAPGSPDAPAASTRANVDEAQCLREAERFGQTLLDRAASAARKSETLKQIEDASAKVKGILRDACAAAGALASEEALAATEKMATAMLEAVRSMRSALDDFYRSLPDEQKRRLEALPKELNDWLRSFGSKDGSPPGDTTGRSLGRICFADSCFDIPGNFDFGRSDRGRDRDDWRRR
jgi:LTXXQ motif family protein